MGSRRLLREEEGRKKEHNDDKVVDILIEETLGCSIMSTRVPTRIRVAFSQPDDTILYSMKNAVSIYIHSIALPPPCRARRRIT